MSNLVLVKFNVPVEVLSVFYFTLLVISSLNVNKSSLIFLYNIISQFNYDLETFHLTMSV